MLQRMWLYEITKELGIAKHCVIVIMHTVVGSILNGKKTGRLSL